MLRSAEINTLLYSIGQKYVSTLQIVSLFGPLCYKPLKYCTVDLNFYHYFTNKWRREAMGSSKTLVHYWPTTVILRRSPRALNTVRLKHQIQQQSICMQFHSKVTPVIHRQVSLANLLLIVICIDTGAKSACAEAITRQENNKSHVQVNICSKCQLQLSEQIQCPLFQNSNCCSRFLQTNVPQILQTGCSCCQFMYLFKFYNQV